MIPKTEFTAKMKALGLVVLTLLVVSTAAFSDSCDKPANTTAKDEQASTEINQRELLTRQPPPRISWSLERDNLTKRFKLMNDRATVFYMYLFIEGHNAPVGYYLVNKVSSVDSQLTNPSQLVKGDGGQYSMDYILPSPAEDGSYGTNGQGVFGFTPEDVYLETNLKYVVSTIPLNFPNVTQLAIINTDKAKELLEASKKVMGK